MLYPQPDVPGKGLARYVSGDALALVVETFEKAWAADSVDDALSIYRAFELAAWGTPLHHPLMAALGLCDRYYLMTHILTCAHMIKADPKARQWLYARCREVQAEPWDHLDLWAREHYKSTIITFGGAMQELLRDPDITIGIFSHTRPVAKSFLQQIKRELEANERLKQLYSDILFQTPERQSTKWSEDDGLIIKRRTNRREATVEAWGLVDGQPIGRHFDRMFYDDVVTDKSVTTPEQVAKTSTAFQLSDNLGTVGGKRAYIGTRYHLADTYHEMLQARTVKPRIYPATHDGTWDGEPVFLPPEELERKKRTQPRTFAAQMLQAPAAGPQKVFDLKTFKRWEVRPRTVRVYILIDPARGPGSQTVRGSDRDRTAMAVVAVDQQEKRYLVDGFRHRMTLGERWENLRNLHRKWSSVRGVTAVHVGYERYGLQTDLEHFEMMMRLEGYTFGIDEVAWPREGPASKDDRVARLVPDLVDGRFLLPCCVWHESLGDCWWGISPQGEVVYEPTADRLTAIQKRVGEFAPDLVMDKPIKRLDENKAIYDLTRDFLEEALYFPFGLHDDLLDAVSRIYDMKPVAAQIVDESLLEPTEYIDGV